MNLSRFAIVCASLIIVGWTASPSLAQQKTVKQCQDEWRSNKADNQAKGIKEKDYVAQCRGTADTAAPAGAPVQTNVAPPPSAPSSKGKSAKECRAEWRANKADNEAKGITEKQYIAQCRDGAIAVAPTPAPSTYTAASAFCADDYRQHTAFGFPDCPHWCGSISDGGRSERALLQRYRCLGKSEIENLPLRGNEELRKHQRRHLHVRERGNSSRRSSVKDGKASLG